jgi:hypothetical protein
MRRGKLMLTGLVVLLLVCAVPVAAISDKTNGNADTRDKPKMIVEYGTGKDIGLIKVTHIDYAKSESKGKPPQTATCYKLAKWRWSPPIKYTLDSTSFPQGSPFETALDAAKDAWDSNTKANLFDTFLSGSGTAGDQDTTNLITFGNYPQNSVIAVTYTWYDPRTKLAVDSDILFNTYYSWSTTEAASSMDLQNIATHEMGHTLGLSDIYTASCDTVTMYGYSTEGETAKSSLADPDIAGLQLIYGP